MTGPTSEELIDTYSISAIQHQLRLLAPRLFDLLTAIVLPPMRYYEAHTAARDSETSVTYTILNLLKHRTDRAMGLPLIITFLLISKGTSKQVSKDFHPTCINWQLPFQVQLIITVHTHSKVHTSGSLATALFCTSIHTGTSIARNEGGEQRQEKKGRKRKNHGKKRKKRKPLKHIHNHNINGKNWHLLYARDIAYFTGNTFLYPGIHLLNIKCSHYWRCFSFKNGTSFTYKLTQWTLHIHVWLNSTVHCIRVSAIGYRHSKPFGSDSILQASMADDQHRLLSCCHSGQLWVYDNLNITI